MTDKKLTDAEIKKALECCMKLTPDCDDCPYWGVRDFGNCFDFAGQDALDLINRLQNDVIEKEQEYEDMLYQRNSVERHLEIAKAENERLKKSNRNWRRKVQRLRERLAGVDK